MYVHTSHTKATTPHYILAPFHLLNGVSYGEHLQLHSAFYKIYQSTSASGWIYQLSPTTLTIRHQLKADSFLRGHTISILVTNMSTSPVKHYDDIKKWS